MEIPRTEELTAGSVWAVLELLAVHLLQLHFPSFNHVSSAFTNQGLQRVHRRVDFSVEKNPHDVRITDFRRKLHQRLTTTLLHTPVHWFTLEPEFTGDRVG